MSESPLEDHFQVYWNEFEKCREARCLWSMLHMVFALPGICAAQETERGETTGRDKSLYEGWCRSFLTQSVLSPEQWYKARCKLFHQGNSVDLIYFDGSKAIKIVPLEHGVRTGEGIPVDVEKLADEVIVGVKTWLTQLMGEKRSNVLRNIGQIVFTPSGGVSTAAQTAVTVWPLRIWPMPASESGAIDVSKLDDEGNPLSR